MAILNVFAIIVAGLMVGSELAIAAFVHPTLVRLSDTVHLPACKRSGARVGEIHAVLVHPCILAYFSRGLDPIGTNPAAYRS